MNPTVVIGRSQATRVVPVADAIGAETYTGGPNLWSNIKWIVKKVLNGYDVVDIGLDPLHGPPNGIYYGAEKFITRFLM